jgi:hypothetical protein
MNVQPRVLIVVPPSVADTVAGRMRLNHAFINVWQMLFSSKHLAVSTGIFVMRCLVPISLPSFTHEMNYRDLNAVVTRAVDSRRFDVDHVVCVSDCVWGRSDCPCIMLCPSTTLCSLHVHEATHVFVHTDLVKDHEFVVRLASDVSDVFRLHPLHFDDDHTPSSTMPALRWVGCLGMMR